MIKRLKSLLLALMLTLPCLAWGQDASPQVPSIHTVNGAEIFRTYCATCHGLDGRGNGPVAPALKHKVPDLTQISKRAGGKFPIVRVRNTIEGTETLSGHGSREMPIWGPVFHRIDVDQDLGNVRADNLAKYIESIQQK
jgi:mono/diheme cytochrome c family protein